MCPAGRANALRSGRFPDGLVRCHAVPPALPSAAARVPARHQSKCCHPPEHLACVAMQWPPTLLLPSRHYGPSCTAVAQVSLCHGSQQAPTHHSALSSCTHQLWLPASCCPQVCRPWSPCTIRAAKPKATSTLVHAAGPLITLPVLSPTALHCCLRRGPDPP